MMTKREKLISDISDIKKGLDSDLEEKFKVSLRALLKKKEDELESLKDEKPAEKKVTAPKKAESKKAEPKKAEPSKKSPKDALANCKELLAKYTKEKASAKKRVEKRKKQGKPAELTPSETVSKTAKSVKSKVIDMKDKGLSAGEIDKLANGIIATIKSTLAGIKTTTGKHAFLSQIKKEISTIDGGLSKVAMEGGLFADGGMMADGEYGTYKVTFQDGTEDSLTWSEYAYANSKQQAIQRSAESLMSKYPNYNFGKMKVIQVEEGEKFADGGMTSVGGTTYSSADLSGFFREGGYNYGSAWTKDRNEFNKSEKYEVPMSQRKYAEGGMAGQRDLGEYFEKKKYSYEEGGIVDENTEMLLSQIKEIRHHADEIQKLIDNNTEVEAWVVAKAERSATDLSDITHYIDGKNQMFADGGVIKWQDVEVGDSANVKAENKTGLIIQAYGRKFHLKFVDGSEKTYDASELQFFKDDEDEYDEGFIVLSDYEKKRLDELQYKEDIHDLNESENIEYEELVKKYRKTKDYNPKYAHGGMVSVGDLVRVKKYGWVMRVVDMDEQSGMYQLENDREGTMNGNAGGYLESDIEPMHTEYARGGYNTGRAWTLDHYQHNKSEKYEKPVSDRKYYDGGDLVMLPKNFVSEIQESVRMGYDEVKTGMISPKRRGVMLVNSEYQVRGAYPLELKDTIERIVNKAKGTMADGGMMPERGLLNRVEVMFEEPQYNYVTSVASAITEEDARRYFVGKMFDVGRFPNELMKRVVDIKFIKGSLQYRDGGDLAEEKQELKKIIGEKYEEFVELLGENIKDPKFKKAIEELAKDKPVRYKVIGVSCEDLKPTQKEISMAKSLAFPLTSPTLAEQYLNSKEPIRIAGKTILTCDNGKYIIDGHHRWSQVYLLNPKSKMACTDFYDLKNPIMGLKATQLGVSADLGYTPVQKVEDINLLTISESELKKFVRDKITPEVKEVFDRNGINDPEEHIWKNVQLLKKNNKPIKGASKRDYMPQTDDAKDFAQKMPNISKLKKGGKVKFSDKVKAIQKSLLERKKVSPSVQKDYGKTYSKPETLDSARRIAGAKRKSELQKKK